MDYDENDIMFTNKFVKSPEVSDGNSEFNAEFTKYYKREKEAEESRRVRDSLERMSLRSIQLDEDNDATSLLATNRFSKDSQSITEPTQRRKKDVKTFVSIDSRDRDKKLFSRANFFKIFLGKTFYNVKSIRLASIEFPNTNAVINSTNNRIYWRNKEDIVNDIIDSVTKTYPVYDVELRIGSYITTTLKTEMTDKMIALKRKNGVGDFHYFLISLDLDTDIVKFTSLLLKILQNNPFTVIEGSGVITVKASNHGYQTGDKIYFVGSKTVAGISSATLAGPHIITKLDNNNFNFEVNVKAGESATGGGNTVASGQESEFQLLFGENTRTVAQNIGYPLENSSQRIDTYVKSIENFYQVQIKTKTPHRFERSFDFIGTTCTLADTNVTGVNGNRVITNILDPYTFLISVNTKVTSSSFNSGFVTYKGRVVDIASVSNYATSTVLVTTYTDHRYTLLDVGAHFTIYNTTTKPSFNGDNTINNVLSSTELLVPGDVLVGGEIRTVTPDTGAGTIPQYDPIQTHYLPIANVIPGVFTTIISPNHGLQANDKIKIRGLVTQPSVTQNNIGIYSVHTVPDSDTFTIDFTTTSVNTESIQEGGVGRNTITLRFPYHGFNKIIEITDVGSGNVKIKTFLPHGYETGDKVRISQSNSVPSIDTPRESDAAYLITKIDDDEFTIAFGSSVSPGTFGILGMSYEFYIYGADSVGGIVSDAINNIKFQLTDILDEHTITVDCNDFASSNEYGGGNNVYISSLLHGFSGVQENTKNSLLNRSINLEGENYAFLCCPQLATMMNTGKVNNVFARITLDQSPGSVVFAYLSNPKEYDPIPLDKISELEFSVVNYDNTLYEFNDLDYSFTLEITEEIDTTDQFNRSSKRGI